MGLYEELIRHGQGRAYPYHMPGHKRQLRQEPLADMYDLDITEIPGFDDLHAPEGLIAEIERGYADIYHGAGTHLLVNGATAGVLAGICALCPEGSRVLVDRSSHQSVYHALLLRGLRAEYLWGYIDGEMLEKAIKGDDISAVILTSPSYEGATLPVGDLAKICHRHGIPLMLDASHGAHFVLDGRFPMDGVEAGADIVVHSIHKTLPALTQTALVHVQGDLADEATLRFWLGIYQTSSPSYILMGGMGRCLDIIRDRGRDLCETFFSLRESYPIAGTGDDGSVVYDPGKLLLIPPRGMTGPDLFLILVKKYDLWPEMCTVSSVLMILTIMDTEEGFRRLYEACRELGVRAGQPEYANNMTQGPQIVYTIKNAMDQEMESLPLSQSPGRVAGAFVRIYPPGIPLLVPGERIEDRLVDTLMEAMAKGLTIKGLGQDGSLDCIKRRGAIGNYLP